MTAEAGKQNWREPDIYKQFNSREGIIQWKTTEEAAMAADLKAVGSTAADQEEHSTRVAKEDRLTATESHSERESHLVTDHVEVSVRVARGHAEASVKTISAVKESRSATDRADHSQRAARESRSAVREEASVKAEKEDRSVERERASAVRGNHSATDHAEASARVAREDHSMVKERASAVTGSHSAEREEASVQRRASTRRISTISVMRTRAESTR